MKTKYANVKIERGVPFEENRGRPKGTVEKGSLLSVLHRMKPGDSFAVPGGGNSTALHTVLARARRDGKAPDGVFKSARTDDGARRIWRIS